MTPPTLTHPHADTPAAAASEPTTFRVLVKTGERVEAAMHELQTASHLNQPGCNCNAVRARALQGAI